MQQFSAVTWSLKRYQQLSYPLLYAVIQTDTKKLLIRRKDSTNRGQKQPRVRGCFAEVPSVFCKDSTNRSQKQPRSRGCFAEVPSVFCKDSTNRSQKQPRLRGCFAEVPSVFCKGSTNRSQKQPRLRGCFAEMRSVCADGADKPGTAADAGRDRWPVTAAERAALRCGVARRGGQAGERRPCVVRSSCGMQGGRFAGGEGGISRRGRERTSDGSHISCARNGIVTVLSSASGFFAHENGGRNAFPSTRSLHE